MKQKETILRVNSESELMPFLISKMGGMSRNGVKLLLSRRQVQLNGKIETRYNAMLNTGDEVRIVSGAAKHELVHPKVRVVYEDDYLIVVEKKQGLLTVPTFAGSTETTCYSILRHYVRQADPRAGVFVVHRLDRETSGLLVFAKSADLQEYMRTYWRQLVTKRTYVALAEGIIEPEEGKITTWLTEDKRTTRVYSSDTDNGGKIAITNYKVVKTSASDAEQGIYSLVELNLETGRTNQIRVHLADMGHPVVGDRKYGSGTLPVIDRLALHARILEFVHPATEETVHFETPVPREFLKVFH
ncbi:MAG: RluA family pseudouridine synthase [Paludibacter sp.]|nr:RluA family pseudouridine synthase [Bacteroidales bacterium]MCM1068664.1 RluA family pseudouridine synthase [Prevotella sp.]MCM1353328.1 RluA family pseudouridine synthase [Bacteroides sp.]MCM1442264.1 RluA family pseudouridine synthase [Muribaculum sp.]MCM1481083.1 RluA family pseudouridine synthase [Paludibacter sp.]